MTPKERDTLARPFLEKCLTELLRKGEDYAVKQDCNQNFVSRAGMTLLSPYKIWSADISKHLQAIFNAINNAEETGTSPELTAESLDSRIMDGINYLFILHTMLKEPKGNLVDVTVPSVVPKKDYKYFLHIGRSSSPETYRRFKALHRQELSYFGWEVIEPNFQDKEYILTLGGSHDSTKMNQYHTDNLTASFRQINEEEQKKNG